MRRIANMLVTTTIVTFELASLCVAMPSAFAQETSHRQLSRQQQIIQQQQRQIREYQRQLAAQQQAAPQEDMGLLGVLGCPRGYIYSWFGKGCYPNLPVSVVVTPPRY